MLKQVQHDVIFNSNHFHTLAVDLKEKIMNPFPNTQTETDIEEEILRAEKQLNEIIIYNDDFNTFQFVIDTLVKVCGHEPLQAEQCTLMIHYNGKCSVKRGEYKKLRPLCENILERGLTAEIQ